MNSQKLGIFPWMVAALSGAMFLVSSCEKASTPVSKLTRANFDQIHEKMSKEEVQAILGSPSSTSTEDKLIYKRTTWRYVEGDNVYQYHFQE
jgi:outer membrane protein assembly factor BamE (lipoprotein component of BamABCDE complex)